MRVIRMGSTGAPVRRWQVFLTGQGHYHGLVDGGFGQKTHDATVAFQQRWRLDDDGVVGNRTYGQAMLLGFTAVRDDDESERSPNFPAPPDFRPLVTDTDRQRIFERFDFVHEPLPHDPDAVRILGDWEERNIEWVNIPQLKGFKNAKRNGDTQFHKLAAPQLVTLWQSWEAEGLLSRVLSYEGSFVPRFVRGSRMRLSNHAFGSAFDINLKWNRLGAMPALKGQEGCVRELVGIANELGFYWGGHFTRLDGMHFEIARLIP